MKLLITENLQMHAENQPEKVFTIFEGREWTYGEFFEKAQRIAAYFQEKEYGKDDIIALYARNSDTFLVVYYGLQLGGFTVMPVNTRLAASEVDFIFNHSEARAIIYDQALIDTFKETSREFETAITFDGENGELESIFADDSLVFTPVKLEEEDTATIMYTSGTTGNPKGVMLTHRNLRAVSQTWQEALKMQETDRMLISTPMFHCAALHCFITPTTYSGGSIAIEEAFSPVGTLHTLQTVKPTIFFGVPTMYSIMLNLPEIKEVSLSSLRLFCYGAAPMPYELVKQLKETFPNIGVQNLYGQTENSPGATTLKDHLALDKIGSVGEPLPNTEVRVVGEDEQDMPTGEVGQIIVKGPQVMKGYYKNEKETNRTLRNGWLFTGDLGKFDEDGLLYIVDREKDMIIRGGENVYPIEVEEVLYQIPQLLEATVVGIPHEIYGEVPKAFVVFKEGESISKEDILEYARKNLARYKVPTEIEVVDELPRNASGKVLKHVLRSREQKLMSTK